MNYKIYYIGIQLRGVVEVTFVNLHSDTECQCINSQTLENLTDLFTRKLESDNVTEKDFSSYWEFGKRPNDLTDCRKVCAHKGVSLNRLRDTDALLRAYRETEKLKPVARRYKYYCEIKFKKNAGLIHQSCRKRSNHHCNLFKSDAFTLDKIEIVRILPINYDD